MSNRKAAFVLGSAFAVAMATVGAAPVVNSSSNSLPSKILSVVSPQPANADPCWVSNADFKEWTQEVFGTYNNTPGWGDSLTHVKGLLGCVGSWGPLPPPGYRCGLNNSQWYSWSQSDGDQVWIQFRDRGAGSDPRYVARCSAGIQPAGSAPYNEWVHEQ